MQAIWKFILDGEFEIGSIYNHISGFANRLAIIAYKSIVCVFYKAVKEFIASKFERMEPCELSNFPYFLLYVYLF